MQDELQHEDLLIKLRSKLNTEKIKLWEAPYTESTNGAKSLKDLAVKYAAELTMNPEEVLEGLKELQLHSMERSKANEEFKETGMATFRVKANVPGEKALTLNVMKKLTAAGSELIEAVSAAVGIVHSRLKLIVNGKVLKSAPTLDEQGIKNGAQVMALVMAESLEATTKAHSLYMEMKSTRDDAELLSEYVDDYDQDDEYMKLEDQSGKTVELPPAERRSLLVGLALHERGRAAINKQDFPLALVLLLEADRLFSECRSSILARVDNTAVLQLDIAWCYVCLRSLQHASDATRRLACAERGFIQTYGENRQRLVALKGSDVNERVLFMRLYLLQGVAAYHQGRRQDAHALLARAEAEVALLKVDEQAVRRLEAAGWRAAAARGALRTAGGDEARAAVLLARDKAERDQAREKHRANRQNRALGVCVDGAPVSAQLVDALVGMGFRRRLAIAALRNSNNHVADAVKLIQEDPQVLAESDDSSDEETSSEHSLMEPDDQLVQELIAMGYTPDLARYALKQSRNHISGAIDILHQDDPGNPSTSAAGTTKKKKSNKNDRKKQRDEALARLRSAIRSDAEDYLDTALDQEQAILAQYQALLQ